jgi:hypothetical protein
MISEAAGRFVIAMIDPKSITSDSAFRPAVNSAGILAIMAVGELPSLARARAETATEPSSPRY